MRTCLRGAAFSFFFLLFFAAGLSVVPASAQSNGNSGSITGTVSDSTGAVVRGATDTLQNPVSQYERSAKTEADRRSISVEQVWRERAAIYPQNRVLEPREVAQVIVFLCSDAAGAVNGEAITVALGGVW